MAVELSQVSYLLQAWGRIAKCLGQDSDFIPYLAVVMPPLLKSAEVKPDITITDADDYDEDEEEEGTETVTLNNKRIEIDPDFGAGGEGDAGLQHDLLLHHGVEGRLPAVHRPRRKDHDPAGQVRVSRRGPECRGDVHARARQVCSHRHEEGPM
jgi:hypothetical protein